MITETIAFVVGWMLRSTVAMVNDLVYAWRYERFRRQQQAKWETLMDRRWIVNLRGIDWDDGKGEYDVSDLPKEMQICVLADDEDLAFEIALTEATELWGSLINGVSSYQVMQKQTR